MEKITIKTEIRRLSHSELSDAERRLVQLALDATAGSYSPYSGFAVGAALEFSDGTTLSASNQENSSYPAGICAERNALFFAQANFPGKRIATLAIAARSKGVQTREPVTPCGICRQVMLEVSARQQAPIALLLAGCDEVLTISDARKLLPLQFDGGLMK